MNPVLFTEQKPCSVKNIRNPPTSRDKLGSPEKQSRPFCQPQVAWSAWRHLHCKRLPRASGYIRGVGSTYFKCRDGMMGSLDRPEIGITFRLSLCIVMMDKIKSQESLGDWGSLGICIVGSGGLGLACRRGWGLWWKNYAGDRGDVGCHQYRHLNYLLHTVIASVVLVRGNCGFPSELEPSSRRVSRRSEENRHWAALWPSVTSTLCKGLRRLAI